MSTSISVRCDDFCVSKLDMTQKNYNVAIGNKFVKTPKYHYATNTSTMLSIVTDEITMCHGGIPNLDNMHRFKESQYMNIKIPLNSTNGFINNGGEKLCKVMENIDIASKKSSMDDDFFVSDSNMIDVSDAFTYSPCVRSENGSQKYMIAKLKFDIEQTSDDYNVYQSTIIRTPIIITEDDDEVIKPKSLNELRKYMTCGTKVVFQLDLEKTTLSYDDDDLLCHRMSHHFVISRITITKPRAYADKKESTDFSDDDMEQVASSGKTLAERMRLKTQKACNLAKSKINEIGYEIAIEQINRHASSRYSTTIDLNSNTKFMVVSDKIKGSDLNILGDIISKLESDGFKIKNVKEDKLIFTVEW